MVTAFILINARRDKMSETANALNLLDGVAEVYSVAGQYDIVAVIRVKSNNALAALVAGKLLKIEGIEHTQTLIAFQAFSTYDLERMFSIGTEEEKA